jgi:hypothetical protein
MGKKAGKKIEPGHYELSCDVKNPKPDRRSKDWNKHERWPAGTKIYVRQTNIDNEIEFIDSRWPLLHSISTYSEAYDAIGAALKPVEETYRRLLHRLSVQNTYWLLKRLVIMGKITLADIEQASREEDTSDDQPMATSDPEV